MIGDVWEWCSADDRASFVLGSEEIAEVRGGGFLDNLFMQKKLPAKTVYELTDSVETSHSDLGFRIVVEIAFSDLADTDQVKVAAFPPLYT